MTATFNIKKEIEHTINVQVPSFWQKGSKVIGVLDTDSVFVVRNYTSIQVISMEVQSLDKSIAGEIQEMTEISEDEFFTEYNKAYESLRLKPELKTELFSELVGKVVNHQNY